MSRVAVVTGAASGMGRAVAERLASHEHRVGLVDLDGEAVTGAAEVIVQSGGRAIALKVDITDRAAIEDAFAKVRSEFGPIEILVTSAGLDEFQSFTDITPDAWERM